MNHLEYYRYYEAISDDYVCIDCNDLCNGDHADNEGFPLCDECFEELEAQPVVEQPQNPEPQETHES